MYLAELENPGVSFFYLARTAARETVGFCSFWRVLDELHINNLAVLPAHRRARVGTALLLRVLAEARGWARTARRSKSGARTSPRGSCTSGSASRSPASGALYYTNPVEDALVLWRDGLP